MADISCRWFVSCPFTYTVKYTGQDLIDFGYKPGKWFSEALKRLNASEEVLSKNDIVRILDELVPKIVKPL